MTTFGTAADAREPLPGGDASSSVCWIEGEYVAGEEARIPIFDRALKSSDCTYDTFGVWDGRFFRFDDHLDRLAAGVEKLSMALPLPRDEIREILIEAVRRSGLRRAFVEAIVTRGVSARENRDPRLSQTQLYVIAYPYFSFAPPEGADVVLARTVRRIPPDSIDPTVKNYQWGDFMRALFEAYDRGASLPLLADHSGNLTEGAGYNVFLVREGSITTPARGVLEGITRRTVLELAEEAGIDTIVDDLPVDELYAAEEIFLTSTAGGVMPVARLDGDKLDASPGPLTTQLRDRYWEAHSDPRYTLKVNYAM